MKAILSLDGSFAEVIDLKLYLDIPTRDKLAELYRLHDWPFDPPDAWIWQFADVCALYFRARRHADIFGSDPDQARVLYSIESAIKDSMADEFS